MARTTLPSIRKGTKTAVSGSAMGSKDEETDDPDVLGLRDSTPQNLASEDKVRKSNTSWVSSFAGGDTSVSSWRRKGNKNDIMDFDVDFDPEAEADGMVRQGEKKGNELFEQFDREAAMLHESIAEDKHKTIGFDQDDQPKEKRKGLFSILSGVVDDILVPPAMRTAWEKEKQEYIEEKKQEAKDKYDKSYSKWDQLGKDPDEEEALREKRLEEMRQGIRKAGVLKTFEKTKLGSYGTKYGKPKKGIDALATSKASYVGETYNCAPDGHGHQNYASGGSYEGTYNMQQREGYGRLLYPDGSEYQGQFYMNQIHGFGVLKGKTGKTYRGTWHRGQRHGFGELTDRRAATVYSGEWSEGKKEGYGIQLWCKSGNVFVGQWKLGIKHGSGVLRSDSEYDGAGRMFQEWVQGRVTRQEPYSTLTHGTNTTESGTWAAHYAKDAAMDAGLVAEQRVPYPDHPQRPARQVDYVVQMAMEKATQQKQSVEGEGPAGKDEKEVEQVCDEVKLKGEDGRVRVSAREFRRLISLVHSSDNEVEQFVLPILNEAEEITGAAAGEEGFLIGPIWAENVFKLQCHFATKIQRQWRRTGMARLMKKVRKLSVDEGESWDDLQHRLEERVSAERRADASVAEKEVEASSAQLLDRRMILDGHGAVAELAHKARQLFGLEARVVPSVETMDTVLLSSRMMLRLDELKLDFSERRARRRSRRPSSSAGTKHKYVTATQDDAEGEAEDRELHLGSCVLQDGTQFSGEMRHKLPEGFGQSQQPDGSTYAGKFVGGLQHGMGVYRSKTGGVEQVYRGEWLKGAKNGFGVESVIDAESGRVSDQLVEYDMGDVLASEICPQGEHVEWFFACSEAEGYGQQAALESRAVVPEGKRQGLEMSQLIEFDLDLGLASYVGEYDDLGRRHGLGRQTWHDGVEYAGEFKAGGADGHGREAYPDGTVYMGQMKGGRRHGIGKYSTPRGVVYVGEWADGMRQGRGVEQEERHGQLLWVALVQYDRDEMVHLASLSAKRERDWLELMDGVVRKAARAASRAVPAAKMEFLPGNPEGALWYVGGQTVGKRAGYGVQVLVDGTRYIGEWLENKMEGLGVQNYPDGGVYSGEFSNNDRNGFGKYTHGTDIQYLGQWKDGHRHGKGLERTAVRMAAGVIFREFYVEYNKDKETNRLILSNRNAEWIERANSLVARAQEVSENTVQLYRDMLE